MRVQQETREGTPGRPPVGQAAGEGFLLGTLASGPRQAVVDHVAS